MSRFLLSIFTLHRWQTRILYPIAFAAVVIAGSAVGIYLLRLLGIQ